MVRSSAARRSALLRREPVTALPSPARQLSRRCSETTRPSLGSPREDSRVSGETDPPSLRRLWIVTRLTHEYGTRAARGNAPLPRRAGLNRSRLTGRSLLPPRLRSSSPAAGFNPLGGHRVQATPGLLVSTSQAPSTAESGSRRTALALRLAQCGVGCRYILIESSRLRLGGGGFSGGPALGEGNDKRVRSPCTTCMALMGGCRWRDSQTT